MNLAFEKTSDLTAQLSIQLIPEDYKDDFENELNKYRKKANIKGFRPGKVPGGVIKKMYGRPVLADVINNKVIKHLYDYLNENNVQILGAPLSAENQPEVDLNPLQLEEYSFTFDLGLTPVLDLKGLTKETALTRYKVAVGEDKVENEIQDLRKKVGKSIEIEEDIQENDRVQILAKELENGEIKPKGIETEFSVLVSKIPNEELKNTLLSGKKGFSFDFDVYQIESGDEAHIRKYILQMDEDDDREVGNLFRGEVISVSRIGEADLDQTFYDMVFGEGTVKDLDEAKDIIRKHLANQTAGREEALLYREIQDVLLEENKFDLPEAFLKRWLESNRKPEDATMTEQGFENFLMNLRWSLINNKIAGDHEISVTEEELVSTFKYDIQQYMQGYPMDDEMLTNFANRMMQDEKAVEKREDEILSDKIFKKVTSLVTIQEVEISEEELEEKLKIAREEAALIRGESPDLPGDDEEE